MDDMNNDKNVKLNEKNINQKKTKHCSDYEKINDNCTDESKKSADDEIKELKDHVLRLAAELQNLKTRTEKEKSDISKFAISNFAKDVLTIRDNLLLALKTCSDSDSKIAEGIKMTVANMDNIMEKQGIKIVKALNEKFDPTVHQAINEVESDKEKGTVVTVMQDGFMIADRLLRPALVSVAK